MIKKFITTMFLGLSLALCFPMIIDAQTNDESDNKIIVDAPTNDESDNKIIVDVPTNDESGNKITLPGGAVEITEIDKDNFSSRLIETQEKIQISVSSYRDVPVYGVDFFSQTTKYPKDSHLKIFYFSEEMIIDIFIKPNIENHPLDAFTFVRHDLYSWGKGESSVFVMKLLGLQPIQKDKSTFIPWENEKTGNYDVEKMEVFDINTVYATRLFYNKPYIFLVLFEIDTNAYKTTTKEQKLSVEKFCKDTIASIVIKAGVIKTEVIETEEIETAVVETEKTEEIETEVVKTE